MCFPPVCFFPLFFCGFHHPFLNATQLKPYLPPRVSDPLAAPWLLGRPHHWCCLHGRWHLLLTNFTSRLLRPWAWMQLHCPVALFITCWLAVSPRFSWGGCCFLRRLLASKYLGPVPPTKQKWKEVGRSAAKEIWKHTAHCKCGLSSAKKCFWSLKSFFFLSFLFTGSEIKTDQQKGTVGSWWMSAKSTKRGKSDQKQSVWQGSWLPRSAD